VRPQAEPLPVGSASQGAPSGAAPAIGREVILRWTILGLLCLAFIAAYFDRQSLSSAVTLPAFKSYFKLSDIDRGVVLTGFFISYAVLMIPAGWLVDRYGSKRTLAAGFLIWSVTAAATSLATGFWMLFALRVLLGVGEAVVNPAGMRWIRFNMPEKRRGLAIGFYMASAKIGPAVAGPLANALMTGYGWRPMFVILGLGCLVWLVPWMLLVRDDDRQIERVQQKTSGVAPVPFGRVMKSPVIWGTIVGTFAYQYFLYFTMTWMPAYFVEHRHLSFNKMGVYTFFQFAGMATVAIVSGWVADRMIARGRDAVNVRRAFSLAGLILGSTQLIGAFSHSTHVAVFFAIFSLSGLGLMTANYWALTQTLIPGGAVGKIVGVQNCAAQLPGLTAPIVTGWLVQRTGSYEAPMALIGVFLALGILAYVFVVKRKYAPTAA